MLYVLFFLQLLSSVLLLFYGYRLTRDATPLSGMLLGGLLGTALVSLIQIPVPAQVQPFLPVIAFVVVGVLVALISNPFYSFFLFLLSTVVGALFGYFLGLLFRLGGDPRNIFLVVKDLSVIHTLQIFLIVIGAIVFGLVSTRSPEISAQLATAFIGGLSAAFTLAIMLSPIIPVLSRWYVVVFVWLGLGFIGLMSQNSMEKRG